MNPLTQLLKSLNNEIAFAEKSSISVCYMHVLSPLKYAEIRINQAK